MYKVLVVEDNPSDATVIKFLLTQFGYESDFTTNPYDADDLLFNNTYHLILLDWQLPKMSGLEYLKKIKRNPKKKSIPIIMMSGRSELNDIKMAQKEGVSNYIVKPIDPNILKTKMKELLFAQEKTDMVGIPENFNKTAGLISNPLTLKAMNGEEIIFETNCYLKTGEIYSLSFEVFNELSIPSIEVKIIHEENNHTTNKHLYIGKPQHLDETQIQKMRIICKTLLTLASPHV